MEYPYHRVTSFRDEKVEGVPFKYDVTQQNNIDSHFDHLRDLGRPVVMVKSIGKSEKRWCSVWVMGVEVIDCDNKRVPNNEKLDGVIVREANDFMTEMARHEIARELKEEVVIGGSVEVEFIPVFDVKEGHESLKQKLKEGLNE